MRCSLRRVRLVMKTMVFWLANVLSLDCHCYGLTLVIMSGMWAGGLYCSLSAFDLEEFCRKSSEIKVTDLHIVPPVALLLAISPIAQKYDLASLQRIVISAAPLKVGLPKKVIESPWNLKR